MKKTKILVPALAVLALGMAASVTGTVAWYSASTANRYTNLVGTGSVTVADAETEIGNVYFIVTKSETAVTKLLMTNRCGRTYYRSGNAYQEIYSTDTGSTLAAVATQTSSPKKQAGISWDVSIATTAEGTTAPTAAALASIAGTYTVKVAASGDLKVSSSKTSALTTDKATPVYNFNLKNNPNDGEETPVTAATGALGAAAEQEVTLGTIVIAANGSVTETISTGSSTAWATVNSAVTSNVVTYYGLECTSGEAEDDPSEAGALTPSVVMPS